MKPFDEVIHIPTGRRVTINLIGKSGTGMVVVTWIRSKLRRASSSRIEPTCRGSRCGT